MSVVSICLPRDIVDTASQFKQTLEIGIMLQRIKPDPNLRLYIHNCTLANDLDIRDIWSFNLLDAAISTGDPEDIRDTLEFIKCKEYELIRGMFAFGSSIDKAFAENLTEFVRDFIVEGGRANLDPYLLRVIFEWLADIDVECVEDVCSTFGKDYEDVQMLIKRVVPEIKGSKVARFHFDRIAEYSGRTTNRKMLDIYTNVLRDHVCVMDEDECRKVDRHLYRIFELLLHGKPEEIDSWLSLYNGYFEALFA